MNPIDWKKTRCVICKFSLQVNVKGPNVPANEISYADFYIRYEHKFLKNIYTKEELETSRELASLQSYHEVFDRFLTIAILLESDKCKKFIQDHYTGSESYHEIAEQIK